MTKSYPVVGKPVLRGLASERTSRIILASHLKVRPYFFVFSYLVLIILLYRNLQTNPPSKIGSISTADQAFRYVHGRYYRGV